MQRQVFRPDFSSGFFVSARPRARPIHSPFTKPMLTRKISLLTFLIILPLAAIAAEKEGDSITLAAALARTLRGSPELAAYNFELRAAEARILQAGLRPNPEIGLDIESPTGSGQFKGGDQNQNTLTLSQLIELGGKRPARIAEAEAGRPQWAAGLALPWCRRRLRWPGKARPRACRTAGRPTWMLASRRSACSPGPAGMPHSKLRSPGSRSC